LTDEKGFMGPQDYECESERLNLLIKGLTEVVGQIEEKIQKIIDQDKTLSHQHELLCSIE
jgi:hypothetical protein